MRRVLDGAVHLRRIEPDQWPLWRQLRLQALEEAPYAFGSKLAEWQGDGDTEARWRARLSAVPVNIVADLNGIAAGMVSAMTPNQDGTVELISMWVTPSARGHGVGDSLIIAVIEWAKSTRAGSIALAVFERNEPALALYRRHGFVDAGVIDRDGSEVADERQMIRFLDRLK